MNPIDTIALAEMVLLFGQH